MRSITMEAQQKLAKAIQNTADLCFALSDYPMAMLDSAGKIIATNSYWFDEFGVSSLQSTIFDIFNGVSRKDMDLPTPQRHITNITAFYTKLEGLSVPYQIKFVYVPKDNVVYAKVSKLSDTVYQEIFNESPDALYLYDFDGFIIDVNTAACKLEALVKNNIIGKHITDLASPEQYKDIMELHYEIIAGKSSFNRGRLALADGTIKQAEYRTNIVEFNGSKAVLMSVRELSSTAVHDSKSNIALQATLHDDVLLYVRKDKVVLIYKNVRDEINYDIRQEQTTKKLQDFFPESVTHIIEQYIQYTLKENKINIFEYSQKEKDKTKFFEARMATYNDNSVVAQIKDITDRVEAEEVLKAKVAEVARYSAELQQFAYITSHDLQEPLRMISSYLQLLERRYSNQLDESGKLFIDYAVDGAKRMYGLINDLLAYSRVGRKSVAFQKTSVKQLVDVVLLELNNQIEEKDITVRVHELPSLVLDPAQIKQLYYNLIENAVKFSRNDVAAYVEIGADQMDDKWLFYIKDNGIGIKEEFRERVFEIFQRLHTRDEFEGTGMGLAISKKIIEFHKGSIWVETNPEGGTIFFFTLPDKYTL